jgi:hypothetical protein
MEIGATIPPAAAAPVAHGIRKQGRPLLGAHMAPSGHDTNLGTAPTPHGFQLGVRDIRGPINRPHEQLANHLITIPNLPDNSLSTFATSSV